MTLRATARCPSVTKSWTLDCGTSCATPCYPQAMGICTAGLLDIIHEGCTYIKS
jgi:hypothetical protein